MGDRRVETEDWLAREMTLGLSLAKQICTDGQSALRQVWVDILDGAEAASPWS